MNAVKDRVVDLLVGEKVNLRVWHGLSQVSRGLAGGVCVFFPSGCKDKPTGF